MLSPPHLSTLEIFENSNQNFGGMDGKLGRTFQKKRSNQ